MRERHALVSRDIVPQKCLWEVCEIPNNRSSMVLRVHGELAMLTKGIKIHIGYRIVYDLFCSQTYM